MKRIAAIITILMTTISSLTYASYQPNDTDKKLTKKLITQITKINNNDKIIQHSFVRQIDTLLKTHNDNDTRIHYLLQSIRDHFYNDLIQKKKQTTDSVKLNYATFLRRHKDQLTDDRSLPSSCFTYIDDLDLLAYVHDISLPTLIATWYREYTCGYSLPHNTRGPMQIISKNYGTGSFVNHEQFLQVMEDYITFSKGKYNRYNRVTDSGQPITLSYTSISYADIVKHGALYNGLSGSTIYGNIAPAAPGYVFDKFGANYASAKREGIMSAAAKMMIWWITHK